MPIDCDCQPDESGTPALVHGGATVNLKRAIPAWPAVIIVHLAGCTPPSEAGGNRQPEQRRHRSPSVSAMIPILMSEWSRLPGAVGRDHNVNVDSLVEAAAMRLGTK